MRKTALCMLLLAALCLTLFAGCGSEETETTAATEAVVETQTATEQETKAPTEKPTEKETTEAPKETTAATTAATTAPTTAPTTQAPTTQAPTETEPEVDLRAIAMNYVGSSVNSLYAAIGYPGGSSYASSCNGPGEDGELYYPGFTVYTYREGGVETVVAVY